MRQFYVYLNLGMACLGDMSTSGAARLCMPGCIFAAFKPARLKDLLDLGLDLGYSARLWSQSIQRV